MSARAAKAPRDAVFGVLVLGSAGLVAAAGVLSVLAPYAWNSLVGAALETFAVMWP